VYGLVHILVHVDDIIVAGKSLDGVRAVKNVGGSAHSLFWVTSW